MSCFGEFKYSSFAFRSAILSILSSEVVLCHSWQFPSCFMIHKLSGMRYFKSINLFVGVILGYISSKAFPKECCSLWWLPMIQVFSYPLGKSSFHLFFDLKQAIVSVSGRLSPHNFEMFSISPLQAYSFRCWFFQQLRYNLLGRVLSKIICGRSWHFLLRSFIPTI